MYAFGSIVSWGDWHIWALGMSVGAFVTWLAFKRSFEDFRLENASLVSKWRTPLSYLAVGLFTFISGFALGDLRHIYKGDTFKAGYETRELEQLNKNDTFLSGYRSRELEQFHNMNTIAGVTVVGRGSDAHEIIFEQATTKRQFTGRFCDAYIPNFPAGTKLYDLTYEDKETCWNLAFPKLGYYINREGEHNE